MATPDVRVKLSAEGVAEITAAFRKEQTEAQAAAQKGTQSFGAFNTVLGSCQKLLAGLGLAATVAGFVSFTRSAADAADALGENAQAAGTTAQRFSALGTIARVNGGDADLMREALGRLAVRIEELRAGSATAIAPFAKLGLTFKNFEGKDTAQQLEVLANALAKLPESSEKTALAIDLLGRRGARLIPILNELSRVGLAGAVEEAKRLGVLLDDEVVDAAGRVSDELTLLNQAAQALATQFVAGLSPAVHQTFQLMTDEMAANQDIWREFGSVTGQVLKFLIALLLELGDAVVLTISTVGALLGGVVGSLIAVVTGKLDRVPIIWQNTLTSLERLTNDFDERLKRRTTQVFTPAPTAAPRPTPGGTGTVPGADAAAFSQRLSATRSFLDSQLKAIQLGIKLEQEAEARRFAQGLTSIAAYYDRRRALIEQGVGAEVAALEKRRAIEAQNPDTAAGLQAVKATEAEIARVRQQGRGDVAQISAEQIDATQKLGEERLKYEAEVLAVQGKNHAARIQQIDQEVAEFEKVLSKQGLPDDEVFSRINAFRQLLSAGAEFDQRIAQFQSELSAMQAAKTAVAQDVAAAAISEEQGQREILELEKQRIPGLEKIAELALVAAQATGDPEKIAQAEDLALSIRNLGVAASKSELDLKNLHQTIGNELLPVLTDFLAGGEQGFQNFGQAVLGVIGNVIDALRKLTAEILATKILESLGFSFAGHKDGGVVRRAGGGLIRLAGGGVPAAGASGFVRGPGTTTSDSIPAPWISDQEFVVRAAVTTSAGMLPVLHAINEGKLRARDIVSRRRGFKDGGLVGEGSPQTVGPLSATAKVSGRIGVALGPGLVASEIREPAGQQAILEVINGNREAARRALGLS